MDRLDARKEQILALVVREYVRTAEPVGSKNLETQCGISPATIRNEMATLTDLGFLSQPHTSAGRVPTEAAYRYYIGHSLAGILPDMRDFQAVLDDPAYRTGRRDNESEKLRHMARLLARETGSSVFVSTPDDMYLTGLSFLFGQPEFLSPAFVQDVSLALDTLEEHMTELVNSAPNPVTALVGSENPFHEGCATMMLRTGSGDKVVFGVLGPVRMDYDRVMPLLQGIQKLMQE